MGEVRHRLTERDDAVVAGHLAPPEPCELREDEPHPVARLVTRPELGDDPVVHRLLGDDEPVEVEHHRAIVRGQNTEMSEGGPPRISADELALRLGVDRERVRQLSSAGAIESDADGWFDPGDVHRVRLLLAFEAGGVPLAALLDASRAGAISLRYYDELHAPPGPLSDRSYAEFAESLGPGRHVVTRLFAAFGLAEPDAETHLSVADERLIAEMAMTAVDTGQPDLALRAVRLFGEAARRAADGALGVYAEAAARSDEDLRGLPIDDLFDRRLRPWARFARVSGTLAAWLMDRHMSRAIDDYSVTETERTLEDAGFVAARLEVPPAIAFVDLTGFTRMTEERGDEVAAEVAMRLGEVTVDTIAGRGGRIVKLLGDGVLVRFDDATAAAEGALDLLVALPSRRASDRPMPVWPPDP